MKIKYLAILIPLASSAIEAREIDVSNDINRNFYIGYSQQYDNGCSVYTLSYVEHDKYILKASDKCSDLSDDKLYKDMVASMKTIKATSNSPSFAHFSAVELENRRLLEHSPFLKTENQDYIPSSGYPTQFCVDGEKDSYFFADISNHEQGGWNVAYKDPGRSGKLVRFGAWQIALHGEVILIHPLSGQSVVFNQDGTRACGFVNKYRHPNG